MADDKPIVPDPAYQGIAATSPQPQDVTSPEAQKHYEAMFPVHPEATTIHLQHPLAQVADRSTLDLFMGQAVEKGDIGNQVHDDQVLAKQGQKETEQIPYGPIKVQAQRLLPEYNDLGKTRPFGPGEAVQMPDGGMTSEETLTVQMPNGKWSVIPGLWLVNGVPTKVTEDQAVALATRSGLDWPYTFNNQQQADAYAVQREATWEKTPMSLSMTTAQPALWKRRNGTRSTDR